MSFRPHPARLGAEDGQSLIEALLAAAIGLVVLAAVGSLLVSSGLQQARNANYATAISATQSQLDGMVGQIAAATNIISETSNSVDMDVSIGGASYEVVYECDIPSTNGWNKCVRVQAPAGTALPPLSSGTTVIPYLSNGSIAQPVFAWSAQTSAPAAGTGTSTTAVPVVPDYVTATVKVPAGNGTTATQLALARTINYSSGALIRNVDVPN